MKLTISYVLTHTRGRILGAVRGANQVHDRDFIRYWSCQSSFWNPNNN